MLLGDVTSKFIPHLTAVQCPSNDSTYRMLPSDHRRQEICSNILVHTLVDLNLSCFMKTSEEWKHFRLSKFQDIQVY